VHEAKLQEHMLSADSRAARHRRSPPQQGKEKPHLQQIFCVSLPNPRSRSKNGCLLEQ
jgi:hypothetical protein